MIPKRVKKIYWKNRIKISGLFFKNGSKQTFVFMSLGGSFR
jgi:hypothetical protein